MDSEDRLEIRRRRLVSTLHQAVELLLSNGDVRYVICARLRDKETNKLTMGILTNMSYANENGVSVPATPGMLMDIILEAMLDEPAVSGPEGSVPMPKNPYKM